MASAQAQAYIDAVFAVRGATRDYSTSGVAAQREAYLGFGELASEPDGVRYKDVVAGDVPAQWAIPEVSAPDSVLQYLHGGGYVIGSTATHRKLVGHLAKALGCRVLSVDYALAPEHPYPAQLTDSLAAYRWLLAEGFDPGRIAIAGDSAGGGLTIATMLKLRDGAGPLPAAAVVLSPWTDLEGTGESWVTRADVDIYVADGTDRAFTDLVLAGGDIRDPFVSPVHADLTGLPSLYIQVGDHEVLLSDSTRLADNARAVGGDVRIDVFPEMWHVFQQGAGTVPESDDALARIAAWLQPRLGITA